MRRMFRKSCFVALFLTLLSVQAVVQEVKTNVCNMTLTAEGEPDEGERQVQCMCNSISAICNDLGITGLPTLISFPRNIIKASFSGNYLVEIEDNTFYHGKEIIEIDLSHNQIDFVSVVAFSAFSKLQHLSLSHNRIFNLAGGSFSGLTDLRMLDLSFNEIKQLFRDAFKHLATLEDLRLNGNPIHEIEPQHLNPLTNLRSLNLGAIMLSEVPDHLFMNASKLKVLSLANNLLTTVPTDSLTYLKSLKHLDLSGNLIKTIEPEAFVGLSSMQVLYLDRMPELKQIEAFAFGDLRRLRELHCSYNFQLDQVHKDAFVEKRTGDLAVVEQLFLRENNLDRLPADLIRWTKNMELDLRGNPWDCRCHTQWLIYLKTKTEFQKHVRCSTPAIFQGHKLSDLRNQELPCGLSVLEIAFLAGLSLLAVSLCLALVGFILHRKRFRDSTEPHYENFRKTGVDEIDYEKGFEL